jgi:hypothetical protein
MKKRLISVIAAISVFASSTIVSFAAPKDIPFAERPFTVNTEAIDTAIETLKADLEKSNNKDKVFEDYYNLLDLSSQNDDTYQLNIAETEKLDYTMESNYKRDELNENCSQSLEYEKNINLAIKSILDSQYSDDFKEYWGEERTAIVESITDEIDDAYKQFNDRYYELLRNNADGVEFAKLLKEIINYRMGYDDVDSEIISDVEEDDYSEDDESNAIWDFCVQFGDYYYYVNKFKNYGDHNGMSDMNSDVTVENPLEALSFVGKIDSRLKNAYDYLLKNDLCFYQQSDEYLAGTTYMQYYYGDAEVLVTDYNVLETLIHEFGHFQVSYNADVSSEDVFFQENIYSPMAEFESQMFELIATDYYDEFYGENAEAMKFNLLTSNMQKIANAATMTTYEMFLYSEDVYSESAEDIDKYMSNVFGEDWYETCEFYFTLPGGMLQYALTMYDAVQVYDMYLNDKDSGLEKYFEACSYTDGSYESITKELGLVSAFDENAYDYLCELTDDIFMKEYNIDYDTALDYFENQTYLGSVFPTKQRVSVNGGEPQTLFAYNSNGYNYIAIRDLAMLLSGTESQFDVEYDADTYTVNIIPNKPYTPNGTEMQEIEAVETAGMKSSGTAALLYDGNDTGFAKAIFLNGRNCYLLRGLAEYNILDITVDYDAENDIVEISTK